MAKQNNPKPTTRPAINPGTKERGRTTPKPVKPKNYPKK